MSLLIYFCCCCFFKIQSEIVDVFMTFTRPIVQSADHEEGMLCRLNYLCYTSRVILNKLDHYF